MQLQDLSNLSEAIRTATEMYYGLTATPGPITSPSKSLRPLCASIGVGLLGGGLTVQSPTGKPVLELIVTWSLRIHKGGDEDDLGNWDYWSFMSGDLERQEPPLATATIKDVELGLGGPRGSMDITDLRCFVREHLKAEFPAVNTRLTDPARG